MAVRETLTLFDPRRRMVLEGWQDEVGAGTLLRIIITLSDDREEIESFLSISKLLQEP